MVTDLQGAGPDAPRAPETLGSKAEAPERKLKRVSASLRRSAERYRDVTQRQARDVQERALQLVRERPATAVGAAVGGALVAGVLIGFFIGQALSARSDVEEM